MLLIAACTLVLVVAMTGLGAFFCRALEPFLSAEISRETAFGEFGLAGIAGITIVGAALTWLMPLNAFVAATIVTFGLVAAIAFRSRIRDSFRYGSQTLTLVLFLAALLLYVSIKAYWNNFSNHDAGLYHLQTIMLESSSPLTLGAANLHYRFGYNSLWLNDAALLVLPGLGVKTSALINGVLTICGLGAIFQRLCGDLRSRQPATIVVFAAAIISLAIVPLGGDLNLGSPSTDWASSLLTLYVYAIALRLIVGARQTDGRRRLDLFLMFAAAAVATTFKLSQAPIALALGVTSLFCHLKDRSLDRGMVAGAFVASLVITLWILRGIGLSGCVFYPVAQTCFSVLPWTVPAHIANFDAASIQAWARVPWASPSIVLANWDWLPVWWSRVSHGTLIPLMASLYFVSAICVAARLVWRDRLHLEIETLDAAKRWAVLGLQVSAIAGIAYWFSTAPDLRFGYGFLIAQPAMLLALTIPVRRAGGVSEPRSSIAVAQAVAGLLLMASLMDVLVFGRQAFVATDRPSVPAVQVTSHRSKSGFVYSTPVGSDQCWATPLYCAIEREDSLTFNHAGMWPMFTQQTRGGKSAMAY